MTCDQLGKSTPLDELLFALFELVKREESLEVADRAAAGHAFEDRASQKVYLVAKTLGLQAYPPRSTLPLPTFSGLEYQLDASCAWGQNVCLIECKRRKLSVREQIYYFNAKIIDYVLGCMSEGRGERFKGLFLSTAQLDRSSVIYAWAYGMDVLDPYSPPIGYMLRTAKNGDLRKALQDLKQKVPVINPLYTPNQKRVLQTETLYSRYTFLRKRWRED